MARKRFRRRARRGQSEVVGGLIILALLFAMVVPMMIDTYNRTVNMGTQLKRSLSEQKTAYNERITVVPLDPDDPVVQRRGLAPGVNIKNVGTVSVSLVKLILIDSQNNSIYRIYDLRYARPQKTPDIKEMLLDIENLEDLLSGKSGKPLPPVGQPIRLDPGENLIVSFSDNLLPVAPHLMVLVESARGIIHPTGAGGGPQANLTLYPGRPASAVAPPGAYRGIFAPQSGFELQDGSTLLANGQAWAWRPPHRVYTCDRYGDPVDVQYYSSFIYDDSDYPGLYKVYLEVGDEYWWRTDYYLCIDGSWYAIDDSTVVIKGYVGTYDPGRGTYISGYAYEVYIDGSLVASPRSAVNLGSSGISVTDFDANGISELTFYSYLNGPNYASTSNIDADEDGNEYGDALAWTYMASRDISGVDFIKITVKVNYYWTTVFSSSTGCPDWDTRDLRIFAIAVWEYQDDGTWKIHQFRDFVFTSTKPKQYQETAVFPVDRTKTYRVGVIFYDNYRDWYGFGYWCHTDFTFSLEHMIVEYGILNPFFQESPPLYIVAIPDPNLISGIGEQDYAQAFNITDINEAKLKAQETLLKKLEEELNYAGISGYTVITSIDQGCDLLFGPVPPKYAVVIWLQGGNVSVPYVFGSAYGKWCITSDEDVYERIRDYHWVWVWPMETPFATPAALAVYNSKISLTDYGEYEANITLAGKTARREAYAFYLFNTLKFVRLATLEPGYEDLLIENGTFYNTTIGGIEYYGTSAFWVYPGPSGGSIPGAIVINPVHLDWDLSGDGVSVTTLVQQVVYSSLKTWSFVRSQ
ncbi:MAG: hypothetical protein F7C34_03780 [Desulfurococcales archaeon]|nr:hypothetical protein [Desulfurococcales archaeon]